MPENCPMNKEMNNTLERELLINRVSGDKRVVVECLLDGYNFNEIKDIIGVDHNQIYKIKKALQMDFIDLYRQNKTEIEKQNHRQVKAFLDHAVDLSKGNTLAQFSNYFINDYDAEAFAKNWKATAFQDTMYDLWEKYAKTCVMAPREHLKTSSVLAYLTKKVYERKYPIEINYYHLSKEIAGEKFRKLRRIVENNPLLAHNFGLKDVKRDSQTYLELEDGTIIRPMSWGQGSVGKHPHIIVLDDVIDRRVAYSDERNKKSIDRFYSDIYPQISKDDPDKKIIIIGTAQREDDLYSSLPADFVKRIYRAITEKGEPLSPELFNLEALEKIKSDISAIHGEKYWLKEYMNTPFNAMGDTIKREWIKRFSEIPKDLDIYQGWDLSVGKDPEKGDWTVGVTIGVKRVDDKLYIYVLDVFRKRMDFDARLKAVVEQANKWKPLKIAIEENVFQYDTVQTVQKQTNLPIVGVRTIKNKVEKFSVDLAPHFENGKVFIKLDEEEYDSMGKPITTFDDFVGELLSLPFGEFDDQADGLVLAIKASGLDSEIPIIDFL